MKIYMIVNEKTSGGLTSLGAFMSRKQAERACADYLEKNVEPRIRAKDPDANVIIELCSDKSYKTEKFRIVVEQNNIRYLMGIYKVVAVELHDEEL
jgi:hypothetical protein